MTLLVLVIYVLAVARITRLINADTVFDRIRLIPARAARSALLAGDDKSRARWDTVVYFLECPWCVGMWISLATAIVPVLMLHWAWWTFLPLALAASHLVGVFSFAADTEEMGIEAVEAG